MFGNRGTGHTSEVVELPLVECTMGVGSGMLLLQGKVEAYLLEQGRVPWGEDIEQWDNPLLVGV